MHEVASDDLPVDFGHHEASSAVRAVGAPPDVILEAFLVAVVREAVDNDCLLAVAMHHPCHCNKEYN